MYACKVGLIFHESQFLTGSATKEICWDSVFFTATFWLSSCKDSRKSSAKSVKDEWEIRSIMNLHLFPCPTVRLVLPYNLNLNRIEELNWVMNLGSIVSAVQQAITCSRECSHPKTCVRTWKICFDARYVARQYATQSYAVSSILNWLLDDNISQ